MFCTVPKSVFLPFEALSPFLSIAKFYIQQSAQILINNTSKLKYVKVIVHCNIRNQLSAWLYNNLQDSFLEQGLCTPSNRQCHTLDAHKIPAL